MKKLHVHIAVKDLQQATEFYSRLFETGPVKQKDDYAKWDLENPPVNFAISQQDHSGLEHLGIEVENSQQLDELYQLTDNHDMTRDEEGETICCYARSEKSWIKDPQGIDWELFHTLNDEESYYGGQQSNCCSSQPDQHACC